MGEAYMGGTQGRDDAPKPGPALWQRPPAGVRMASAAPAHVFAKSMHSSPQSPWAAAPRQIITCDTQGTWRPGLPLAPVRAKGAPAECAEVPRLLPHAATGPHAELHAAGKPRCHCSWHMATSLSRTAGCSTLRCRSHWPSCSTRLPVNAALFCWTACNALPLAGYSETSGAGSFEQPMGITRQKAAVHQLHCLRVNRPTHQLLPPPPPPRGGTGILPGPAQACWSSSQIQQVQLVSGIPQRGAP